jgi:hypothetical protein
VPLTYRRAGARAAHLPEGWRPCRSLTGGLAPMPLTYRRAGAYAAHGWHALGFQIENRLSTIENPSSPEETPV